MRYEKEKIKTENLKVKWIYAATHATIYFVNCHFIIWTDTVYSRNEKRAPDVALSYFRGPPRF